MKTKDIGALKEEVSIIEVLMYYGADINGRGSGEWRPVNCPFCGDRSRSASYTLAGQFLCHQCGAPDRDNGKAGDIIDLVSFVERKTKREAIEWITKRFL